MNNNEKLMHLIGDMEPIEFAGLANLLGVKLIKPLDENKDNQSMEKKSKEELRPEPRDFLDVLNDVMAKFNTLGRARKCEILRLVEKSNSKKRKKNARNS